MLGTCLRFVGRAVAVVSCAALMVCATAVDAQEGLIELALPRPAGTNEAVWLEIRTGALPRGARVRVTTGDGVLVGGVSPFGAPRAAAATAGVHRLPLPQDAIRDGRVQLRLQVEEPGGSIRPPSVGEVDGVALVYVPVTR